MCEKLDRANSSATAFSMFSAFVAEYMSVVMGVRTFKIPYLVETVPDFYSSNSLKVILLAACFAVAGSLFCVLLHKSEHAFKKWFKNPYIRVCVGAAAVIALTFLLGTNAYLGLSEELIHASFTEAQGFQHFLFFDKLVTGILSKPLEGCKGLGPELCAACGMVGVFCAVTNSPISSILISLELFGFAGMPYYCITIAVSYLLSGYQSLYKEQKIVYSKTENRYVNRTTE